MKNSDHRLSIVAKGAPLVAGAVVVAVSPVTEAEAGVYGLPGDTLQTSAIDLSVLTPTGVGANSANIDINGDMIDDYRITVENFVAVGGFFEKATIAGINPSNKIFVQKASPKPLVGGSPPPFARVYNVGDSVMDDGPGNDSATLYTGLDGDTGPFSAAGFSAYVGLSLLVDGTQHNAWAEITRGSITVGTAGFQLVPGAPAPINPVPVPPALALLATGALGLGAMAAHRRRKKA